MSDMTFLSSQKYRSILLFSDGGAPGSAGGPGRGDDDAGHGAWVGNQGKVPGVDLGDTGVRPLGHEQLLGRGDHVVGGADQRPGRDGLPAGSSGGGGHGPERDGARGGAYHAG